MGARYIAVPGAGSGTAGQVNTGTSLKTVLQVATPSNSGLVIEGWGISFEGVASTGVPIQVDFVDVNVAATGLSSITPDKWGSADAQTSLCIGGSALTGSNATAEGTITNSRIIDSQLVHPQSGYSVWYPESTTPGVGYSRFLRIRVTAGTAVDCIPWIMWSEPR